jgi:hypothetical protein
VTTFSEVFKRHKQKFVQKFKNFKNHANETKHHAVCSNHNPAVQNLQKYFALQSLHCLQRPRLFSGGSGRYSSGSPVKHIVDSQRLRFRCRSFPIYISYLRLSSCLYYLLFVVLFLFQNIRIKKLRDDTGWVSHTQMPSRSKTAQELF